MENLNNPLQGFRFQSQLGSEAERRYKEGSNVVRLSLARVIRVNYKYNTVDVMTTKYKNSTMKNPNDNGKFSARLPVRFGGRTPDGKPYGSNTLITNNSLVLIGFLEGDKDNPIVLNIYGDTDNQSQLTRTTFTGADESDEAVQQELWQLFSLYPSMTYHNIDGRGNQEVTFSGRSFMYITDSDQENAYVNDTSFDYDHLPNSRYANGELIEPESPHSPTLLYVHQGVYDDHRVTFFIKSDGTLRIGSKHPKGEGITFQEMNPNGSFHVIKQDESDIPNLPSGKFSKMGINENGNIELKSKEHLMEITDDGVFMDGNPIGSIGGNGNIGDLVDGSASIEIVDGKIELKAEGSTINDINETLEKHQSDITVAYNRINQRVTSSTFNQKLKETREYADNLLKGVNTEIEDVKTSLKGLGSYIDNSFSDGIIEEAEAISIEKYLNGLTTEKEDIDKKFNEIISNQFIPETSATRLTENKTTYDTEHTELVQTINSAIANGKTTQEEKTSVDTAFGDYSTSLSELTTSFEKAIDAIASAKSAKAKGEAISFTEAQFEILDNKITSKVSSEEMNTKLGEVNAKQVATDEKVENVQKEVNEVVKNIPYRAEIISSDGVVFKNNNVDTTLFCKVYRGNEEVTSTINASNFTWTRVSDDPEGDALWNASHSTGKKSIVIDTDDVKNRATFNCEIAGIN